jgi:iron(III) transport system ATP-binding protein
VSQPDVILLDEPLSNLDARLRDTVRKEIRGLVKALNLTILFVTHDQIEALSLSDRIAVMRNGLIVQEGSPRDIYLAPHDGFVANFVGCANQIKGKLALRRDDKQLCIVDTVLGRLQGMCFAGSSVGDDVIFSIRPEIGSLYEYKPDVKTNLIEVDIELLTFTGAFTECVLRSGDIYLENRVINIGNLKEDQKAYLYLPPESCQILPEKD